MLPIGLLKWKTIITLLLLYPLIGFSNSDFTKQKEIEHLLTGNSELSITNPEQAIKNWEKALTLSQELGSDSLTIEVVYKLANFYMMKEDNNSFYELTENYINQPNKKYYRFVAYRELHMLYVIVRRLNMEFDTALKHAFKLLELDEYRNDPLISAYTTIGETFEHAKRYAKGHEYAFKAYQLLKEPLEDISPITITFWKAYATAVLTEANFGLERYDLASKYYDEFNQHMKLNNKSLKFRTHHYLNAFSILDTQEDFEKLKQVYNETQKATYLSREGKNHVAFTLAENTIKQGKKKRPSSIGRQV